MCVRVIPLFYLDKPSIELDNTIYNVKVGSNVTIPCLVKVTGSLWIKNITWYKTGRLPKNKINEKKVYMKKEQKFPLTLKRVKRENAGDYLCTGAHMYGYGTGRVVVAVGGNSILYF